MYIPSGILTIVGVMLATAGSFLTLWTIIREGKKKGEYEHGTHGWLAGLNKSFPKEQKKAVIGCGMIILGGLLQVAGALFTIVR